MCIFLENIYFVAKFISHLQKFHVLVLMRLLRFLISSPQESRFKFLANQNIKLAKFAGFCYGVKRAVDTVKKLKNENPDKNVFILGQLIHNAYVIKELEELDSNDK